MCLSFFDEKKKEWKCQDECLSSFEGKDNLLCGQTNHLTNFALLLSGSKGKSCQSGDPEYVLEWLSLGFVAGALLIVSLFVLVFEVILRWKAHRRLALLSKLTFVRKRI